MLPQRSNPYMNDPNGLPLEAPGSADEIDLVEKMVSHRQAYRTSLQALVQHYDAVGNNQKTTWAKQELTALDRIPQFRYITDVMPTSLKATERITAADQLYEEAEKIRRQAGAIPVPAPLKDEDLLRAALVKYSELITKYPTSDKIDDAAYRMAGVQEDLGDPTLAAQYYQRAYQWDPATPYPARYKAATVLDRKLHRRAEALELYQESVVKEARFAGEKAAAERRIKELTTSQPQ
ncbi:MAG: hypothetical protein A2Y77_17040 [Planctomycetes bacterium RBG_13_62_9]|nr:MAG: hypothetical protein A2Y77_17040 [Planctomycetes bacterium RBG_13_62_9]